MHSKDVTIIIPTSVIPSHPDTRIVEETINSVRHYFPDNEIILQIDGLREERISWKENYDEYKNRILWKCLHEWTNVLPIIFTEHRHQTTMMKETIDLVNTSLIMYIESDTPLIENKINLQECLDLLETEDCNTVRFHFMEEIPEEHFYLMLERKENFIKTIQWSQRPHISKTSYYKDVVLAQSHDKEFIEDRFYSYVVSNDWDINKLWIYYPNNGTDISMSRHLDGRAGTRKFTSDDIVWGLTE
jgi:uncharacterized protein (DUF427 family)